MAEPQAGKQIDYGTLANQARGVDYSALAAQAKGTAPSADPEAGKYAHEGYKSSLPWPLNKAEEMTSDTVNAMAEGFRKMIHGKDADERMGGAHQVLSGFTNSAGVPLTMEAAGI